MTQQTSKKKLVSAGILMYREKVDKNNNIKYKYLIGHPGGPYFSKRDNGEPSLRMTTEKSSGLRPPPLKKEECFC